MKRLTSLLAAVGTFLAWLPSAAAEIADEGARPADERAEESVLRNDVSPLLIAGSAEGVGGGLQLDGLLFALRGSFGYGPLLASIDETDSGGSQRFDVLHTYQVNADGILFFWAPSAYSRIGFSGGYRYNSVLGHGASWGLQAEADVSDHAPLLLSVSTAYFPEGPGRARNAFGNPDGSIHFAFLASLGVRELGLVRAHVPAMVKLTRALWDTGDTEEDPELVAHGYSPAPMVAGAAERALREVIGPGLRVTGVLPRVEPRATTC